MKQVQDKDGNVIEVADNTPCHAGKNGALPVMLDEVLDADIFADMAARDAAHTAAAPERVKEAIRKKIVELEAQQTPRRMREHALGIDIDAATGVSWLANQGALIATERAKLT